MDGLCLPERALEPIGVNVGRSGRLGRLGARAEVRGAAAERRAELIAVNVSRSAGGCQGTVGRTDQQTEADQDAKSRAECTDSSSCQAPVRFERSRYSATSMMTSSSTGMPNGKLATPSTMRTDVFSFPKMLSNNSDAASATFG